MSAQEEYNQRSQIRARIAQTAELVCKQGHWGSVFWQQLCRGSACIMDLDANG